MTKFLFLLFFSCSALFGMHIDKGFKVFDSSQDTHENNKSFILGFLEPWPYALDEIKELDDNEIRNIRC